VGSLALSIDAAVNFLLALWFPANGKAVPPQPRYRPHSPIAPAVAFGGVLWLHFRELDLVEFVEGPDKAIC
jgi:hypothetical protein